MKYAILLIINTIVTLMCLILAPGLPLFSIPQKGKCNNGEYEAVEPRLPKWLNWFQSQDNSLWGEITCNGYWSFYLVIPLPFNKCTDWQWGWDLRKIGKDGEVLEPRVCKFKAALPPFGISGRD